MPRARLTQGSCPAPWQPVDKLPSPARRRIGTGFVAILRCLLTYKSTKVGSAGSSDRALPDAARTTRGLGPFINRLLTAHRVLRDTRPSLTRRDLRTRRAARALRESREARAAHAQRARWGKAETRAVEAPGEGVAALTRLNTALSDTGWAVLTLRTWLAGGGTKAQVEASLARGRATHLALWAVARVVALHPCGVDTPAAVVLALCEGAATRSPNGGRRPILPKAVQAADRPFTETGGLPARHALSPSARLRSARRHEGADGDAECEPPRSHASP